MGNGNFVKSKCIGRCWRGLTEVAERDWLLYQKSTCSTGVSRTKYGKAGLVILTGNTKATTSLGLVFFFFEEVSNFS